MIIRFYKNDSCILTWKRDAIPRKGDLIQISPFNIYQAIQVTWMEDGEVKVDVK